MLGAAADISTWRNAACVDRTERHASQRQHNQQVNDEPLQQESKAQVWSL